MLKTLRKEIPWYALSLGIANGDVFPRVAAFSPGFVISAAAHGRPHFFVSHGRSDQILPIDRCSRVIVPRLQALVGQPDQGATEDFLVSLATQMER